MSFCITSSEIWVHYECPNCGDSGDILVDAMYGQGASLEVYSVECPMCGYEITEND